MNENFNGKKPKYYIFLSKKQNQSENPIPSHGTVWGLRYCRFFSTSMDYFLSFKIIGTNYRYTIVEWNLSAHSGQLAGNAVQSLEDLKYNFRVFF